MYKKQVLSLMLILWFAVQFSFAESVTFKSTSKIEDGTPLMLTGILTKPEGNGPFPAVVLLHGCILLSNSFGQDRPDHFELLSKHFHVAKPKGNGPFPAVMLVPGCTGFNWDFMKTQYDRTQNLLVESGFYTIRVDYLAVRNIPSCMMGVSPEDVANDIGAVVNYLRHLNVVKKHTLNFIGWSFGGAGALKLLKDYNSPGAAKIDAVIAYYPPCVYVQSWNSEVPALILIGANDNAAPPINCKSLFNGLPNPEKVTIRIYDDAYHCFDNRDLPPEMKIGLLGTVGYNEAAAKSAWKEVTDFLKR